ncbi:MAG TPA: hypothetical protein VIL37_02735 [Natronosporangium sp.]
MSDNLFHRIDTTLRREAESLAGGPAFAVDEVVRAGRGAVRRRRMTVLAAVVAVAALVGSGAYAAAPYLDSAGPEVPPATAPPTASVPAPWPELPVAFRQRNEIATADGSRVVLPWPADEVWSVAETPYGWMVETSSGPEQKSELWLLPFDTDEPNLIGELSTPVFAPDGRTLVASTATAREVLAVALPSLAELGRATFENSTDGVTAVAFAGDQVLLADTWGEADSDELAVWDLSTGTVTPVPERAWVYGVSDAGLALLRWDLEGADCIDVVDLSDALPAGGSGWCDEDAAGFGSGAISPDGAWVYLRTDQAESFWIAANDLRAGDWRPVDGPDVPPAWWETDRSYLGRDVSQRFVRCEVSGDCERVGPIPFSDPLLVHRYGQ